MTKTFLSLTISEKVGGGDFRGFLVCRDENDKIWELRAYGATLSEAALDAERRFSEPSKDWDNFGHQLSTEELLEAETSPR